MNNRVTILTVVNFGILRPQLEKTLTGTQGENKHGDPIFLLQFLNVLYMADNCAKFEKKIWVVHPFQGNHLKRPL